MSETKPERVAIVTGAGSGIGRSTAGILVKSAIRCVITGRHRETLEKTAEIIADPERTLIVPSDVTVPEDRKRIVAECIAKFGPPGILVNNAGYARNAPLLTYDLEKWRDVMTVNLEACFFMAQEVIPHMRDKGWGRIINISSVFGSVVMNNKYYTPKFSADNGELGPTRLSAYHASKGGLLTLSRDLAVAVARWGITVNALSPGMILTEQTSNGGIPAEMKQKLSEATPMGRFGLPHEIGHAVRFLASEEASFITGIDLVVDGGWTSW